MRNSISEIIKNINVLSNQRDIEKSLDTDWIKNYNQKIKSLSVIVEVTEV